MAVKNITSKNYEVVIEKAAESPEIRFFGEQGNAFVAMTIDPGSAAECEVQVKISDILEAAMQVSRLSGTSVATRK